MKIILKYSWQLICCLLIALLFLQRQCTREPKTTNTHTVDTITVIKTIHDTKTVYIPGINTVDTVYSEFPFDTLDLIADYFAVKVSNDTIKGENYSIAIRDVITRNRIQSRKATADINIITKTIHEVDSIFYTPDCPKLRHKVYAGIGIGGWTDKVGFAPSLALNTKKDNLYTASYDVINKTAWLSMYWKIRLKKK